MEACRQRVLWVAGSRRLCRPVQCRQLPRRTSTTNWGTLEAGSSGGWEDAQKQAGGRHVSVGQTAGGWVGGRERRGGCRGSDGGSRGILALQRSNIAP